MITQDHLEKIFTLSLEDEQARLEERKFTAAIVKKFTKLLEDHSMDTARVQQYHPAMAWPVFRGVEDPAILEQALQTADTEWQMEPVSADDWWIDMSLGYLATSLTKDTEQQVVLTRTETKDEARALISRALHLMEVAWPEAYHQFQNVVRKIVFVDCNGDHLMSATGAYAFGALFINFNPKWNAINFLDVLLHENGHQSLMIKQSFGRIIGNLTDKAKSPLRKEPRWLNGILHAVFVLWRVCEGFKRVKMSGVALAPEEEATMVALFADFVEKIDETLGTLRDVGTFTEIGEKFISELEVANLTFRQDLTDLFEMGL